MALPITPPPTTNTEFDSVAWTGWFQELMAYLEQIEARLKALGG